MDETLVHCMDENANELYFRPGLIVFLNNVSKYYELILFTTSIKSYADVIIDQIEKNKKFFSYKLYREHSTNYGDYHIKDISLLGRDLKKTIIVDDKSHNFVLQPRNGIWIKPYIKDTSVVNKNDSDYVLYDLERVLLRIVQDNEEDVRISISRYSSEIENKITNA